MARILDRSHVPGEVGPRIQKYWGGRQCYPEVGRDDECPIQWMRDTFVPRALKKLEGKTVTREALLEGLERLLEASKPGFLTSGAPVSMAIYIAVYTSTDEEIAAALQNPDTLKQFLETKLRSMMEDGKLTPDSLEKYFCEKCGPGGTPLVSENVTPSTPQQIAQAQARQVKLDAAAPEPYPTAALFTLNPNAATAGLSSQQAMIT